MNNKEKYDEWVKKVCDFLAEEGPILKRHCATFQSKPIFDKQADVVFLGYNPQEDWGYYEEDSQPTRFYEGNPSFYENNGKERMKWKIWKKLYDALKWAEYTKPVEDGNFVFFNAVYFGSKTINDLKSIPGSSNAINQCLDYTNEVIQDIFKPKCIVCFSIPECFNNLNSKFSFKNVQSVQLHENLSPHIVDFAINKSWKAGVPKINCIVKSGLWGNTPVYGIPHPSSHISNDHWGLIALYLRGEMEKLGI
ncbi:MAG: hypothetical protein J6V74_06275 [Bacteroidales bacterium]|nr:hypothetical protein [Bacteroidales bacterium]